MNSYAANKISHHITQMAVNSSPTTPHAPPAPLTTPCPPTNRILAITCIDFRVHTVIRNFLEESGYTDQYDLVSMAGADLCLAHHGCPMAWADTLLDNIAIGVALHDISEVWVFAHHDCGACKRFGLIGPSTSDVVEREIHHAIADSSRAVLGKRFPDLRVRHMFVGGGVVDCVDGADTAFRVVCDQ